jgi:hypothetical protein
MILQRTANDIKTMNDFVTKREKAFRDQAVSADTLQSKAIQLMNADTSTDPYATKYARAQQQAIEFYQQRKKDAEKMGVSTVTSETLMQENSALVAQVWSESMKTAYRNRIAAEARLQQQRNELKDLDPKTKEAITLKSSIQEGAKNLQKYDAANKKMVNSVLDGYEQMSNNEDARKGMYGAVYDEVGKSIGSLGKLALESVQGANMPGVSNAKRQRMEFEVALRMSTGELDPSVIFAAATGQKSLTIPMVLDITNKLGADSAGQFFSQILQMKDGKAARVLSGLDASGISNVGKAAGLSAGQIDKLLAALRKLAGVKSPGKGAGVGFPKAPKEPVTPRGNQDLPARNRPIKLSGSIGIGADGGKVQKIKTAWQKPSNQGVLKPISPVKVPVKYGEPKGKSELKPDTVKVPVKYGEPKNKVKKPEPINVKVRYDVQGRLPKPKPVAQAVNRHVGKENLPKPDPTEQATNRALGLRPELVTPSPVTQIVNRRVVGGSATGGPFTYAAGGIHNGDGKVTGPGGPTDDKVNARLSNGEYVIRASSVQKYGKDFMNAVNTGAIKTFKSGGIMSKAGNLKADEKKSLLDDSNATIREVNAMSDMTKALKKVLGKGKGGILYDIVRSVMDSFDPKQIKELFKNKGKLKTFGKAFVKQQQLDAKDQLVSAKWDRRAAVKSGKSLAFGASGAVQSSLSADDMKLSARMPGMWDKILTQRTRAEKANQNAGFNRQISRSDASIFGNQLRGNQSLAQAAEALGVSLEDIANKLANSKDYDKAVANIIKMGNAAKAAKEYMDALAMSDTQRTTQRISNNDQRISNLQALAAAKGRQGVQEKFGKSQSVIEAENAVSDAQNAIAQAQIDDINEKYDKQLNILDQIGQHQQAIANLERGRMSVANALSQGDIAAAASAAQQQRNDMAQFARDQMRNQLENQQKAATAQLQQQINDRMRVTRDYQNQIALITAEANANQAVAIGDIQAQSDGWMTAGGYVTDMNAELERQNGILALTTAQLQAAVQAQAQLLNVNPPTLPPASGTGKRMSMSVGSGKGGGGKGHKGKGKGKAFGGFIPGVGNSDSVPTMLTPGEFVVRKAAAAKFGPMLKDMNYGSFQTGDALGGGDVKIDNVVFNINGANLNEREVADIAVRKMHSLNSATIRGGRF